MQTATTILTTRQTVTLANIEMAAGALRTEIIRGVPVAQRGRALGALAVLEHDITRAIGGGVNNVRPTTGADVTGDHCRPTRDNPLGIVRRAAHTKPGD